MAFKISRYGRKRVMSERANLATCDHNLFFFEKRRDYHRLFFQSVFGFLNLHLIDPADRWRYADDDSDDEESDEE